MIDYSKNVIAIKKHHEGQFQYLGRWISKENFRAFVYDDKGNQKLANSYKEFESLTASGLWFSSKPDASRKRQKRDDIIRSNS